MTEKPVDERAWVVKHKRFLFSVVLVFLLSLLLSGCFLGHSAWWKEEVLLHDGQTIIVDRSQKLGGYPYVASTERTILEEKWQFVIPGTKEKVTWIKDGRFPPQGTMLTMILLDILNGVPYIATVPSVCISYNYWGRPNPPYVFFKYDGKTWQRIKLEEFPAELTESNVIVGRPDYQNRTGTIPIARIKQDNRYLEAHLKKIIRQPVKSMDCEEMVTNGKGTWLGIDWFSSEPSYEACVKVCSEQWFSKDYCPCDRLFNTKIQGGK